MGCMGVNDKSVMAETVKAVCKRKSDFQRVVTEGLVVVGFDASVCSLILMLLSLHSTLNSSIRCFHRRFSCQEWSHSVKKKVFNQDLFFKKTVKYVGEPMTHLESIASSACWSFAFLLYVCAAIKVKASIIVCFTSSGRVVRLIAKYRPTMPVLSVVIPRLKTNQLRWSLSGSFEARQSLIVRGLFPMLADPRHPTESTNNTNESILKVTLDQGKASGIIKSHDRVVVCQKVGDSSVVKIIELED
ncbi:hypothetical protein Droror1_Dr00021017 [Drosera rotundifolia]